MINKYKDNNKVFSFFNKSEIDKKENIYTILVGKNGTGKSRLLKSVIENIIGQTDHRGMYSRKRKIEVSSNLEVIIEPAQIIAISTSPFDKFPIDRYTNNDKDEKYSYLGLRNLSSLDLGKAYMSNVFFSLVKSIVFLGQDVSKILKILEYLGYDGVLNARCRVTISKSFMNEILDSSNPMNSFLEYLNKENGLPFSMRRINRDYFKIKNKNNEFIFSEEKISSFLNFYKKYIMNMPSSTVTFDLDSEGMYTDFYMPEFIFEFLNFIDIGFIRLEDIVLNKKEGNSFVISEASSGEQSIVISILGIASKIKDRTLICIDEPEICLHPEWQEKYIDFLITTFKDYKECHFIIATHSPLIVSSLKDKNCFIMSMEDGIAKNAHETNKKSVDFQLANIFGIPGFKNEYLMREFLSILTLLAKGQKIDDIQFVNIKKLLELKSFLKDEDPVKKLMYMTEEALND